MAHEMAVERAAGGTKATDWVERAAAGASLLCLVHCAGLPLLLAALPSLSRALALPESLHLWLLCAVLPSSAFALVAGRAHGSARPLLVGSLGLALLALGALVLLGGPAETPVTIAGSLCLVCAHIANWRLRHRRHRHG